MTKIDIISGFLGAGKTTLIKKLIKEVFEGQKLVLIENEFGEIGIDGGFLKQAGIEITEINSGCICCTLVGDFGTALKDVITKYQPDRVIIEPSGVGKLSDVIKAVEKVKEEFAEVELNSYVAVVDAGKTLMYMKNFGEFFNDQITHARAIILSRTGKTSPERVEKSVKAIKDYNSEATIITTDWDALTGAQILKAMEENDDFVAKVEHEHECGCGHHHEHEHECCQGHHHEEEHECGCGHHHEEEHECCQGHHHEEEHECCQGHHHEEEHECGCGHHHEEEHECGCGHHHEEEHECGCGHHHEEEHECGCGHHHEHEHECGCGGHHHHHADEVFDSMGITTPKAFDKAELEGILEKLAFEGGFGIVLRAKGIVPSAEGGWLEFDLTPGEFEVREGAPDVTGKLCVIGSVLQKEVIKELFGV